MQLTLGSNGNSQSNNKSNQLPENIIVFSHLRWDFVFQRPQHLLTRLSQNFNIYYIEEPIFDAADQEYYTFTKRDKNLWVMVPHLPEGLSHDEHINTLRTMFDRYMENKQAFDYAFWYYTPMALEFTSKHSPALTIYDCMDELSLFDFAPPQLKALEKELLSKADVVFTGGQSLYEAKKDQHHNIYPFPSSIDRKHFLKAREYKTCPPDQINSTQPKLGFYGVLDERFDAELIRGIADARPDWQIILIGPVVKIDPATLPKNKNIHYLGPKSYQELPTYMATWDIALIPFMLNDSTRFISPTKTPEYLAAGLPVVSTAIRDVVNPYGKNSLVHIAGTAEEFVAAAEKELNTTAKEGWQMKVDTFLASNSWDKTCENMTKLMEKAAEKKIYMPIAQ
ncbi:glycosyltransferase family 1 protein [Mucilaginibacter sp. Bleaf8]|uniref:glycosyltransferase family 1 protein n=1 Tax=Mucilaginibacter sp. Bleaf8 TaxID=2834430 RepID=UPI001BD0096C|nr:glycosyltransferase family 1 protein [Mucilaginibacter sp. Bleaf8]MBS7564052.1 glycosyltransferase family 1 protein [Mucilaginibacter sp. Bleaf8]